MSRQGGIPTLPGSADKRRSHMINGHVSVEGDGSHTAHCSACPSWSPTFTGPISQIEADECVQNHLRNAHDLESRPMAPGTPVYDLVFVLRIATPMAGAAEWLANTIGRVIRNAAHNPELIAYLGLGMTNGSCFVKPLPDMLETRITEETVAAWLRDWNGAPE